MKMPKENRKCGLAGSLLLCLGSLSCCGTPEDWRVASFTKTVFSGHGTSAGTATVAKVVSLKTGEKVTLTKGQTFAGGDDRLLITEISTNGAVVESMTGKQYQIPILTKSEYENLKNRGSNNPAHATGKPAPGR
jgi:hypothetical protein